MIGSERKRKRISLVADKGHFVVYTADQSRFVVPLKYLKSQVFRELLELAKQEYGLPRNGPITVPCEALCMENMIMLIQDCGSATNLETSLCKPTAGSRCF
ncbi:auxin-responsive protein SAUR64-like [Mercurialis annua]|uniref:auxin-responsive protein SAUR64-like n=1 Tax=Mercurialis annua TaxID=3986 RepID=UPI00215E8811|nr:auxin-responsive protein SAUR64-like [Mercurialis annua]